MGLMWGGGHGHEIFLENLGGTNFLKVHRLQQKHFKLLKTGLSHSDWSKIKCNNLIGREGGGFMNNLIQGRGGGIAIN